MMPSRDDLIGQLDFALKTAGMGAYTWDLVEGTMHWEAQMYSLFGVEPGGFSGRFDDFLSLLVPEDRARVAEEIAAGLDKGAEFQTEFRILHSPVVRLFEMRAKILVDADGKAKSMSGLCRDVTERNRSIAALQTDRLDLAGTSNERCRIKKTRN
jgi:PAS domain-containing protein